MILNGAIKNLQIGKKIITVWIVSLIINVNYVMFIDSLNIAIVSSTIFVLRRKARLQKVEYKGYRVPFYPVLPAIFVLFLLAISINVLLSEPRPALFGTIIFISGYPIFLLMRGVSKKRAPF